MLCARMQHIAAAKDAGDIMRGGYQEIGERLKHMRSIRGLSQEQMAELLGISRSMYVRYETGDSVPAMDKLCQMADVFCMSVGAFINDPYDTLQESDMKTLIHKFEALSVTSRRSLIECIRLLQLMETEVYENNERRLYP